jgi:hypothetical protein
VDKDASTTYVNYSVATRLSISNEGLHNWTSAKGDLGLAYAGCSLNTPCPATPFQSILLNLTNSGNQHQSSDFQYYYSDQAMDAAGDAQAAPSSFSNSSSLIFGLDLQPSSSTVQSSMQLGFVKPAYNASLVWIHQPLQYPAYHEFLLFHPRLCGVSLLGESIAPSLCYVLHY